MSEAAAVVTRVENGRVWIRSLQTSACGSCAQHGSCDAATLSKLLPAREYAIDGSADLHPGDRVCVTIDDRSLLFSSIALYLVPLVLMLAGVMASELLLPKAIGENWLPEIALASLLAAFGLIRRIQTHLVHFFVMRPRISHKL